MTYTILTECPSFYSYTDEYPVLTRKDAGPYETRVTALAPRTRRMYSLPFQLTNDDRQTLDAFFAALPYAGAYFLFQDPKDGPTTMTPTGTVNGANQTFTLPTGAYAGFYPDAADMIFEVNGSPVTVSSVNVDARTITLAAAPGGGSTLSVTCYVYRLVRLAESFTWQQEAQNFWSTTISIMEEIAG